MQLIKKLTYKNLVIRTKENDKFLGNQKIWWLVSQFDNFSNK